MSERVPFHDATTVGSELEYLREAVATGHLAGDGPQTRLVEALLREELGADHVLLTTSCTHALEMTAHLLDVASGDEVIMPTFTFVSAANAYFLRGARPVFCDIEPDTMNLDVDHVASLIGKRTKAVVPVHYAGVPCAMDALLELTRPRAIAVVEDAAHALFATYGGRTAGTIGDLGTFSFHDSKNFTCGEGGALVLRDPELAARAEILREKGTNRASFFRGEISKYSWVDIGSSYVLSDLLAGFLRAQLEQRQTIQERRRTFWDRYVDQLAEWAETVNVQLPHVPGGVEQAYHLFYLILPSPEARTQFIGHLKEHGVGSAFHYVPLHDSPMGRELGYTRGDFPVAEDRADRLVRLPLHTALTAEQHDIVCHAVRAFTPARVPAPGV